MTEVCKEGKKIYFLELTGLLLLGNSTLFVISWTIFGTIPGTILDRNCGIKKYRRQLLGQFNACFFTCVYVLDGVELFFFEQVS